MIKTNGEIILSNCQFPVLVHPIVHQYHKIIALNPKFHMTGISVNRRLIESTDTLVRFKTVN